MSDVINASSLHRIIGIHNTYTHTHTHKVTVYNTTFDLLPNYIVLKKIGRAHV